MDSLSSQNNKTYFLLYSCIIITASYTCFFQNYYFPKDLYWDENYHVAFAYKYIHGIFYQEIHPPLGKLLIAAGEMIWNPNQNVDVSQIGEQDYLKNLPENFSFIGVRFFPALLAFFSGYVFFLILYLLSQNLHISLIFSSLYIFDNALIAHYRGAMLDGIQMFFMLSAICLCSWMWRKKHFSIKNYYLLGTFTGLALASKVNALILVILFSFLIFEEYRPGIVQRYKHWKTIIPELTKKGIAYGFAIIFVFLLVQYIHTVLTPNLKADKNYVISESHCKGLMEGDLWQPQYSVIATLDWYQFAKNHTKNMGKLNVCDPNENGSLPIGWIIGNKSINYRWVKYFDIKEYHSPYWNFDGNKPISIEDHSKLKPKEQSKYVLVVRYINLLGNPVVWLLGLISIVLSISLVTSTLVFGLKIKDKDTFTLIALFLCMYLGYMTIVISVERVLYLYHYLIPLVFSILLATLNFTYIFKEKSEDDQNKKYVYTYLGLILIIVFAGFIFYAPFSYYWPLTEEEFQARNLLRFWGMKSVR